MNNIHPTAVIAPDVEMGDGNLIGPYCRIYSGVQIGSDNHFESHVSIGSPAEKAGYFLKDRNALLNIGSDNIVREFVTMNSGTRRPTVMGDRCLMLRGSHLSHDTILEDEVVVSCTVMIGGESHIMTGVNLGLGTLLHQFSVVGSYAMIGMGSVCTKKLALKPGGIFMGNPARYLKDNKIGLSRNHITPEILLKEVERWELLRQTNKD